jgi:hypothetical protein
MCGAPERRHFPIVLSQQKWIRKYSCWNRWTNVSWIPRSRTLVSTPRFQTYVWKLVYTHIWCNRRRSFWKDIYSMPQRGVYFLKAMFIRYYNFFSTGWQEIFLNRQLEKKAKKTQWEKKKQSRRRSRCCWQISNRLASFPVISCLEPEKSHYNMYSTDEPRGEGKYYRLYLFQRILIINNDKKQQLMQIYESSHMRFLLTLSCNWYKAIQTPIARCNYSSHMLPPSPPAVKYFQTFRAVKILQQY